MLIAVVAVLAGALGLWLANSHRSAGTPAETSLGTSPDALNSSAIRPSKSAGRELQGDQPNVDLQEAEEPVSFEFFGVIRGSGGEGLQGARVEFVVGAKSAVVAVTSAAGAYGPIRTDKWPDRMMVSLDGLATTKIDLREPITSIKKPWASSKATEGTRSYEIDATLSGASRLVLVRFLWESGLPCGGTSVAFLPDGRKRGEYAASGWEGLPPRPTDGQGFVSFDGVPREVVSGTLIVEPDGLRGWHETRWTASTEGETYLVPEPGVLRIRFEGFPIPNALTIGGAAYKNLPGYVRLDSDEVSLRGVRKGDVLRLGARYFGLADWPIAEAYPVESLAANLEFNCNDVILPTEPRFSESSIERVSYEFCDQALRELTLGELLEAGVGPRDLKLALLSAGRLTYSALLPDSGKPNAPARGSVEYIGAPIDEARVSSPGNLPIRARTVVVGDHVRIVLSPHDAMHTVSIAAEDQNGQPVRVHQCMFEGLSKGLLKVSPNTTEAPGISVQLEEGEYSYIISADDGRAAVGVVAVSKDTQLCVAFDAGASIHGVLDGWGLEGHKYEQVVVALERQHPPSLLMEAPIIAAANGAFDMGGLRPAEYTVNVYGVGLSDGSMRFDLVGTSAVLVPAKAPVHISILDSSRTAARIRVGKTATSAMVRIKESRTGRCYAHFPVSSDGITLGIGPGTYEVTALPYRDAGGSVGPDYAGITTREFSLEYGEKTIVLFD